MYIYIYTWSNYTYDIYIYIYTCTYTCIYMYIHIYIYIYTYTHIHIYIYTSIHIYIFTYTVYRYICTYMHACVHACIHQSIHTYRHTDTNHLNGLFVARCTPGLTHHSPSRACYPKGSSACPEPWTKLAPLRGGTNTRFSVCLLWEVLKFDPEHVGYGRGLIWFDLAWPWKLFR